MTNYIILLLCAIVIISYIFDISARYSKIPGVIFLIILGIILQLTVKALNLKIPEMQPVLPVIGTLGLIMIVTEASLDLKIEKSKKKLITKAVLSSLILFFVFVALLSFILTKYTGCSVRDSLLSAIPLGIISSSVAIPAASYLKPESKEFVIYESSFSDIFGIQLFDFILLSQGTFMQRAAEGVFNSIITLVIAFIMTLILGILLHKIDYHVNYVVIMTSVVMVYVIAKLFHLPALLLVLVFGLVLANQQIFRNSPLKRFIEFEKFEKDVIAFRKIITELTFLVRSFFFIMVGFYTKIEGLLDWHNLGVAAAIVTGIFLLRFLFFRQVLKIPIIPLGFFTPRGLITILLFLSIPLESRIPLISDEVITIVILLTLVIMMIGNILPARSRDWL